MPYVICDEETYDDEVLVFLNEQAAKQEAVRLLQKRRASSGCVGKE